MSPRVGCVRTYGQFCPVALATEVLSERWTLLIVRELLTGSRRFNELRRGVPRMSPTLLSKRLAMLERLGVVERFERADGSRTEYQPTQAAEELRPVVEALGAWGMRWVRAPVTPDEHLDGGLLVWDMRRRVATENLPPQRVVVDLHLEGSTDGRTRFWLVLDRRDVDVCVVDPGYEVDLRVEGHVRDLVRYWMGDAELEELVARRELVVTGPTELVAGFPTWFERNVFADVERSPAST